MASIPTISAILLAAAAAASGATLSPLFSDHMVLQRETAIPVWGRAAPGETVSVSLAGKSAAAKADAAGRWAVRLPPLPAGGPHTMTVAGTTTISLSDVMIGEVWVCSGQSNMGMPLDALTDWETALREADVPGVRIAVVPNETAHEEPEEITPLTSRPLWQRASPGMPRWTAALPWFFARELHERLKVPVGVFCAALGSTCGETWAERRSVEEDPALRHIAREADRAARTYPEERLKYLVRAAPWFDEYFPRGEKSAGFRKGWHAPAFDDTAWETLPDRAPGGYWGGALGVKDGVTAWLRAGVDIPAEWAGKALELNMGRFDHCYEDIYFNGVKVGETHHDVVALSKKERICRVPGEAVAAGRNVIAIHVLYNAGTRFLSPPAVAPAGGGPPRSLAGKLRWKYRVETVRDPAESRRIWKLRPPPPLSPDDGNFPFARFNATIAPLAPYAIRGAAWYQGESNAGRAYEYRALLRALIRGWRRRWGQGDFPFLIVQLSSVAAPPATPGESTWAELREAQAMALAEPAAALIVTADIGDGALHPQDKRGVARRLAAAALRLAAGETRAATGPTYRSCRAEGGKIIMEFAGAAAGLATRGSGPVAGFVVAGADRVFVPARAEIAGGRVAAWSPSVAAPVAARYAWAHDTRDANLCDRDGLPVAPFRTDDWPGLTAGVVWPGP